MINGSETQNKAMQSPEEPTTIRAVSQIKNEYHFAGSGKYKPMNIVASDIDEATKIWQTKRVPVEETEVKETNNE
jgi:hypothetical protein